MKPHKRNGRAAKKARQEAAIERLKTSLGSEKKVRNTIKSDKNKENETHA